MGGTKTKQVRQEEGKIGGAEREGSQGSNAALHANNENGIEVYISWRHRSQEGVCGTYRS